MAWDKWDKKLHLTKIDCIFGVCFVISCKRVETSCDMEWCSECTGWHRIVTTSDWHHRCSAPAGAPLTGRGGTLAKYMGHVTGLQTPGQRLFHITNSSIFQLPPTPPTAYPISIKYLFWQTSFWVKLLTISWYWTDGKLWTICIERVGG